MTSENKTSDSPKESIQKAVSGIQSQVHAISDKLTKDFEVFTNGNKSMELGISLLDTKPHLLLEYITLLSYYSLLKLSKTNIKDHPILLKLIKIRAYLEKVKPLETKMKYQIDKLVKAASLDINNTEQIADDPYMFKPNPNLLVEDNEDENEGDQMKEEGDGLYKAPRIAPMPYDDNPGYSKEQRSEQRKKEKASRSRMLRDLVNQFDEGPEREKVIGTMNLEDRDRELMERETYEEENFIRLTTSKAQKKRIERLNHQSLNNELMDFDDFHGSGKMTELDQSNKHSSLSRSRQFNQDSGSDDDFGAVAKKPKRKHNQLDNIISDGFDSPQLSNSKFSSAKRSMRKKFNKKKRS